MFERVKLKDGNTRWIRSAPTIPLGRREIATAQFERWLMKKEERNANVFGVPRL